MYSRSNDSRVIHLSKKQQHVTQAKRLPKLQVFLIIVSLVWAAYTYFVVQLPNVHKLNGQQQQLNQELSDIKQKNTQLQQTINKLNDDTYIGELARTKYNMKRPGDIILSP